MPNGLVFECYLNTGYLNTILFSYLLVQYLNGQSSTKKKPIGRWKHTSTYSGTVWSQGGYGLVSMILLANRPLLVQCYDNKMVKLSG